VDCYLEHFIQQHELSEFENDPDTNVSNVTFAMLANTANSGSNIFEFDHPAKMKYYLIDNYRRFTPDYREANKPYPHAVTKFSLSHHYFAIHSQYEIDLFLLSQPHKCAFPGPCLLNELLDPTVPFLMREIHFLRSLFLRSVALYFCHTLLNCKEVRNILEFIQMIDDPLSVKDFVQFTRHTTSRTLQLG
jgi:hypothetical protein